MEIKPDAGQYSVNGGLHTEIEIVAASPLMQALLRLLQGIIIVVNEARQVVALNEDARSLMDFDNLSDALGLRPGEVIGCAHAHDVEQGCGHSDFCESCGTAIAIAAAVSDNRPTTRKCVLQRAIGTRHEDRYFQVQSMPFEEKGRRFVLLYLQDIGAQQKWAALEQIFFHDINNILMGMMTASNLLLDDGPENNRDILEQLSRSSRRISQEVAMQRNLLLDDVHGYTPVKNPVSVLEVFQMLKEAFANHPVSNGRNLVIPEVIPQIVIQTDIGVLLRVLSNMVINAFEATPQDGQVVASFELEDGEVIFKIWNSQTIPARVVPRIFQRNFSTKADTGRGLGTYSMKLFGEEMLGGRVSFLTSELAGTEFCIALHL